MRRKKIAGARKGRKVTKHCVFPTWLRRVESRLAKAAGAETSGEMKDEKLHPVVVRMQNYLLTNLGATERLFYLSQNVVAQGMH